MSLQSYNETLVTQPDAGTLLATYTTAKRVINTDALYTLPPNWCKIGRKLRVNVQGAISNIVTTPGLMNFQVVFGAIAVYDSGNIQLNATAHTTLPFWAQIDLTCRAIGDTTSANFMGLGIFTGRMFTTTAGNTDANDDHMPTMLGPATAPVVGTGFDSTIAVIVNFFVGFTISNGGNGVRIDQYELIAVN